VNLNRFKTLSMPRYLLFVIIAIFLVITGIVYSSTQTPAELQISSGRSGNTFVTPQQATLNPGTVQTVRFHVGYTNTDSNGTEFLDQYVNYRTGFVVVVYPNYLYRFSGDPAFEYLDSTIDVTGMVTWYDGYLEILNPFSISLAN